MKKCLKEFAKAVGEEYTGMRLEDWRKCKTVENFDVFTDFFEGLVMNIDKDWDWVKAFRKAQTHALADTRKKIEDNWLKARKEMLDALEAYPRAIPQRTFFLAFEAHFYGYDDHKTVEVVTPYDFTVATVKSQTTDFKKSTKNIKEDTG